MATLKIMAGWMVGKELKLDHAELAGLSVVDLPHAEDAHSLRGRQCFVGVDAQTLHPAHVLDLRGALDEHEAASLSAAKSLAAKISPASSIGKHCKIHPPTLRVFIED